MSKQFVLVFGLFFGMFTVPGVSAGLLGTEITLRYDLGANSTIDVLQVTDALEVSCSSGGANEANVCAFLTAGNQSVDIDDLSINYAYSGSSTASFDPGTPNGFTFQIQNFGGAIANAALWTNIAGLDNSRVSFTADSIQIDMHGLTVDETNNAFSVSVSAAPVPVPAAIWLLTSGLAVLGLRGRSTRRCN